jgi:hypothetical protein
MKFTHPIIWTLIIIIILASSFYVWWNYFHLPIEIISIDATHHTPSTNPTNNESSHSGRRFDFPPEPQYDMTTLNISVKTRPNAVCNAVVFGKELPEQVADENGYITWTAMELGQVSLVTIIVNGRLGSSRNTIRVERNLYQ